MSKIPWFKCYPGDWLNGLADLSPSEACLYVICILRIYDEDGPIPDNLERLARRCNMRLSDCRRAMDGLVARGKLTQKDGFIINDRAQIELLKRESRSVTCSSRAHEGWEKRKENNGASMKTHPSSIADDMLVRSQSQIEERKEGSLAGAKEKPSPPTSISEAKSNGKQAPKQAAWFDVAAVLDARGPDAENRRDAETHAVDADALWQRLQLWAPNAPMSKRRKRDFRRWFLSCILKEVRDRGANGDPNRSGAGNGRNPGSRLDAVAGASRMFIDANKRRNH